MRDRFRAGDLAALGEAYDEHAGVLYRYALRVCGDPATAEDVVSSAFLEAWRGRGRLHADGGSLRPWLLGVVTNVLRGTARQARRRDAAHAKLADRGVLPDFSEDVVARLADAEQLRAARVALTRLRRRDREVFSLVVWAGLDYAAAAEALGIPVGTVRSRLSRARDRLRALADEELRAGRRARARAGAATATSAASAGPAPRTDAAGPATFADVAGSAVFADAEAADRAGGPDPGGLGPAATPATPAPLLVSHRPAPEC
ncbi:RNA polymerase sigma factor [Streptomyces laurentii]|uniref:RNA polymerase sigma factor n=1 Tax=Streptomyces laurentii TaxID=39478 RepID=UPI00368FB8B5